MIFIINMGHRCCDRHRPTDAYFTHLTRFRLTYTVLELRMAWLSDSDSALIRVMYAVRGCYKAATMEPHRTPV